MDLGPQGIEIVTIYGAASPPGRLARALERAATHMRELGLIAETRIDLHASPLQIASAGSPEDDEPTSRAVLAVMRSQGILVASPVYRASYPGVLKNLFDLLPVEALRGKPVGLIVVGATDHHFLGVDRHLRDVLSWFGALPLPVSVYLTSGDFEEGALREAADADLRDLATTLLHFARTAQPRLGPPPLAARPRASG